MKGWEKESDRHFAYYERIKDCNDLSSDEIDAVIKLSIENPNPSAGGIFLQPCVKQSV